MLSASQEMINYINNTVRDDRQYVRVEFATTIIGEALFSVNLADMVSGSITISRRSVANENFDIGQSYIDEAKFTVDRASLQTLYPQSLIGKYCRIYYGVRNLTPNNTEEVQIFTGIVPLGGIEKTRATIHISLDSVMSLFYKPLTSLTSGTPLALLQYACTKCGVTMSQRFINMIGDHPNSSFTFYVSENTSISTYLDLIMWVSQLLSGAVTCNNVGELDYVYYDPNAVPFVLHDDICKTSSVSEDTVFYDSCTIVVDNVETMVVGDASSVYTLQLTDNPLITKMEDGPLRTLIINCICDYIFTTPIRGFSYEYNGNPLIELGDYIQYDNINTYVQSIEYGFRKTSKLEGYTVDNRLNSTSQNVKSAAHSGGGGGTNPDTVGILHYDMPDIKEVYSGWYSPIAEEAMDLYPNTKNFIATTIVFNLNPTLLTSDGTICIRQVYDGTEQPLVAKQSVRQGDRYLTVTINTTVDSSDIYQTHTYVLEAKYIDETNTLRSGVTVGIVDAFQIDTQVIGFMAAGGEPEFTGNYICTANVTLKTDIQNVPVSDIGELEDTVTVDLTTS